MHACMHHQEVAERMMPHAALRGGVRPGKKTFKQLASVLWQEGGRDLYRLHATACALMPKVGLRPSPKLVLHLANGWAKRQQQQPQQQQLQQQQQQPQQPQPTAMILELLQLMDKIGAFGGLCFVPQCALSAVVDVVVVVVVCGAAFCSGDYFC